MILGVEIAMVILGIMALVTGKLTLSSTRIVRGAAARALGILALMPFPLSYGLGCFIGVVAASQGGGIDLKTFFWPMMGIEAGVTVLCAASIYAIGWPLTTPVRPQEERDPEFDQTEAKGPDWRGAEPTDGAPGVCLMLGLLSLGLLFITGIPAILMGIRSLRDIRRGRARPKGETSAAAGIAFGGIGTLTGLGVLIATPILMEIWNAPLEKVAAAPRAFMPRPAVRQGEPIVESRSPVRLAPKAEPTDRTAPIASPRPALRPNNGRPQIIKRLPFGRHDGLEVVATLDTFLAAAVDPASKTVFIAGSGGPIRILSYPEFEPNGTFQLAGTAFRLALDAPRGLLYAFILRDRDPSSRELYLSLDFGALDCGPGDLHVYDVKTILGEGHPLPDGKLEPVVVIPVADQVYRLAMGPDGRRLYWLQGRVKDRFSRPKFPKFVAFDTETRAIAQTLDLPDGTNALSLSPNGKTAYAAGSPADHRGGGRPYKAGWIVEIDLASMVARAPLTIDADPYDIAATDDGRVYLSGHSASSNYLVAMAEVHKARSIVASWASGTGHDFIQLSPDGSQLYFQTTGQSPAALTSWTLPGDPNELPVEQARVSHGLDTEVSIHGDFFITPDGRFLLSGRGSVFQLTTGKSNGK